MALEVAADVAQGEQILHREETAESQSGVEAGGRVSLGEDEAIPVLVFGVGGVHIQLFEIEVGEQVGSGQAAAGMTGLGGMGALNNSKAHLTGGHSQLLFLSCGHSFILLFLK